MRHFFAVFCFIFSLSLLAQESSSPLDAPDLELQKIKRHQLQATTQ